MINALETSMLNVAKSIALPSECEPDDFATTDWKKLSLLSGSELTQGGGPVLPLVGVSLRRWHSWIAGTAETTAETTERTVALDLDDLGVFNRIVLYAGPSSSPSASPSTRPSQERSLRGSYYRIVSIVPRFPSYDPVLDPGKQQSPLFKELANIAFDEDYDDEFLRPSAQARTQMAVIVYRLVEMFDDAHLAKMMFTPDGKGGIEATISHGKRKLQIIVPSNGQDLYIFHKDGNDFAIEKLSTSYEAEGWIRWLFQ